MEERSIVILQFSEDDIEMVRAWGAKTAPIDVWV